MSSRQRVTRQFVTTSQIIGVRVKSQLFGWEREIENAEEPDGCIADFLLYPMFSVYSGSLEQGKQIAQPLRVFAEIAATHSGK